MFSVGSFLPTAKAKLVILPSLVWRTTPWLYTRFSTKINIRTLIEKQWPKNEKKCSNSVIETYFKHWEASASINDKRHLAGTTKNSLQHYLHTLKQLLDSMPPEDKSLIHLLSPIEPFRGVEQHELLAAITAYSSDDVYNKNRNQMLGDAFLEFATVLYLLKHHTDWHVGQLTAIRSVIVSNRNLCSHAINMQLPGMMKARKSVSNKACADCVEAILGCCVKSIGVPRSFKFLETFNILPQVPGESIMTMLDQKLESPRTGTNITDSEVDSFLIDYRTLEKNIGYTFKDRAYLLQALTHPSYLTNHITGSHELLKFLGEAVLYILVTMYIFERCPNMDSGMLTDLRSALIKNETLACLCVRSNIHEHILSQSSELNKLIATFSKFQASKRHEITEHVQLLMGWDYECKMAKCVSPKPPKALGDVFKALVGGIFADSGNGLVVTWDKIYKLMGKELEEFMRDVPIGAGRRLYEFPKANPKFDEFVNRDGGFEVGLRFTCNGKIRIVHGSGTTHENAKRAAAKAALHNLQNCV